MLEVKAKKPPGASLTLYGSQSSSDEASSSSSSSSSGIEVHEVASAALSGLLLSRSFLSLGAEPAEPDSELAEESSDFEEGTSEDGEDEEDEEKMPVGIPYILFRPGSCKSPPNKALKRPCTPLSLKMGRALSPNDRILDG